MEPAPRVALALGSGGARGYAHIGAIQVLEERGYQIAAIAGSSVGALIGGLRAADQLDGFTEWVTGLSQIDVVRLIDPSPSAPGAIRADKLFARVKDLIGDVQIEDLPIPFTAVATDLIARREVWFQQGSLAQAIRASTAMPSVVSPVMLNGRLLADGGLMNPVPVTPTVAVAAELTVAIDLGGEHAQTLERGPVRESAEIRPVEEWLDQFRIRATNFLEGDMVSSLLSRFGSDRSSASADTSSEPEAGAAPDDDTELLPPGLTTMDVMGLSLEAMQSVIVRYRLGGYPPDILVSVPKDTCRSLDLHRAAEVIEVGRQLTIDALDAAGLPVPPPSPPNPNSDGPRPAP